MEKLPQPKQIQKSPTGIQGLDEITNGGVPKGRATLVCGGAGCGKTLLATEFIVRGAAQYGEAGVIITFEESAQELIENVASLGFGLNELIHKKMLAVEHVQVDPGQFVETGIYDLEGLFIRLRQAIQSVGAKRVALDTIETLFGGFPDEAILRSELQRLFRWFKDRGLTVVITGERGEKTLTRHGIEEYVSDCVILLDHRVTEQVSTRRLRIVKYRGTKHGTNEYPFLIGTHGLSVLPITSVGLEHPAVKSRMSSGIPELDEMLGKKGFYRGTSLLISGGTGTGKSSFSAQVADAACARGEHVLYFAFEESEQQILRNMQSIGLHLQKYVRAGLLKFHAERPSAYGLEMHLVMINQAILEYRPKVVIIDPINSFVVGSNRLEVEEMLTRVVDSMKRDGITCLMTNLDHEAASISKDVTLSSLVDSWIQLRHIEIDSRMVYQLFIVKSRGSAHSNRIHEYVITSRGIQFPGGSKR